MKSAAASGIFPKRRAPRPMVRLTAFVGYGDMAAFRRATAAIGEALRSRAVQAELEPRLWRFDQMCDPHWRQRSIDAALGADVVVLASSSADAAGPEVDAWIATYLAATGGRRTTLIVITGENDAWTISLEASAQRESLPMRAACELVA